jgi:predicted RNA-binding Zn ribbon-like protein
MPHPRPFDLDRRALCLDFLNTLGQRPSRQGERLTSYGELVRFALESGALGAAEAERLAAEAGRHAGRAAKALRDAVALRESLYRLLRDRGASRAPARADLKTLNAWVSEAAAHRRLAARGDALDWTWDARAALLRRPVWPIVLSAVELLTSERAPRVRECASETCGWMFLDLSPAGRRRWCDMKSCGNRAKARRHYQRRRRSRSAAGTPTLPAATTGTAP